MEGFNLNQAPKFQSPEEELAYLRAHIAEREHALKNSGVEGSKNELVHSVIESYKKIDTKEVLHPKQVLKEEQAQELVLNLKPEIGFI